MEQLDLALNSCISLLLCLNLHRLRINDYIQGFETRQMLCFCHKNQTITQHTIQDEKTPFLCRFRRCVIICHVFLQSRKPPQMKPNRKNKPYPLSTLTELPSYLPTATRQCSPAPLSDGIPTGRDSIMPAL